MGDPRIVFVSREVYPFDSAGLGNYVLFTAAALADVAEVTIVTSALHEPRYRELVAAGDARLPDGVRFEFVPEPRAEEAADWYGVLHLWSARAQAALVRLYPDGGPDLVEFPDYLGEDASRRSRSRPWTAGFATRSSACARTRPRRCARCSTAICPTTAMPAICTRSSASPCATRTGSCGPAAACSPPTTRSTARTGSRPPPGIPHTVVPGPELEAAPPADDELRFLYVGRLERRKGVQNLIRAATACRAPTGRSPSSAATLRRRRSGNSMRDQLELMIGADSADQDARPGPARAAAEPVRRRPRLRLAVAVGVLAEYRPRGVRAEPPGPRDPGRRAPGDGRAAAQRMAGGRHQRRRAARPHGGDHGRPRRAGRDGRLRTRPGEASSG